MTAFADIGRYKTPLIKTPPAADILNAIRCGSSYADLAIAYGCSESTLRRRIQDSGLVAKRRHGGRPAPIVKDDLPEWMDRGLCAETDPAIFFVDKGKSAREAKSVCRACDVRTECLAYALNNDERWGIWAGMTPVERKRLMKNKPEEKP